MTENTDQSKEDKLYISNENNVKIRKLLNGKTYKRDHEIPDVINKSELSDYCIDVLETFGIEAPALLNEYSCAVEDALIQATEKIKELRQDMEDAQRQIIEHRQFKKQVLVSLGIVGDEPTTRTEYTED